MTVESYAQAPAYTIAGVGPYPIPHPYLTGTIVAYVLIEDIPTQLDGADFSVDPAMAADQGNLLLTAAAATTHDGRTLWIERATPLEQGWMARDDGREAGMEAQLDQDVMGAQEDRAQINAALRARKPMAAFDPQAGRVPIVRQDGLGWENGPSANEVEAAQQYATNAGDSAALSEKWAQGTEPGGPGTKSAKEWAELVALGELEQAKAATAADAQATAADRVQTGLDVTSAQTAEAGAVSAESGAIAARDAAFVNADVYADIATGRAAVADGDQFQVVNGDEVIRYRRDSSTTQTEMARYPSSAFVKKNSVSVAKATGWIAILDDGTGNVVAPRFHWKFGQGDVWVNDRLLPELTALTDNGDGTYTAKEVPNGLADGVTVFFKYSRDGHTGTPSGTYVSLVANNTSLQSEVGAIAVLDDGGSGTLCFTTQNRAAATIEQAKMQQFGSEWGVLAVPASGNAAYRTENAAPYAGAASTQYNPAIGMGIGRRTSSTANALANADVLEVIVFAGALSDAQQQMVLDYIDPFKEPPDNEQIHPVWLPVVKRADGSKKVPTLLVDWKRDRCWWRGRERSIDDALADVGDGFQSVLRKPPRLRADTGVTIFCDVQPTPFYGYANQPSGYPFHASRVIAAPAGAQGRLECAISASGSVDPGGLLNNSVYCSNLGAFYPIGAGPRPAAIGGTPGTYRGQGIIRMGTAQVTSGNILTKYDAYPSTQTAGTVSAYTPQDYWRFGNKYDGSAPLTNCDLEQVIIFDEALTADEMEQVGSFNEYGLPPALVIGDSFNNVQALMEMMRLHFAAQGCTYLPMMSDGQGGRGMSFHKDFIDAWLTEHDFLRDYMLILNEGGFDYSSLGLDGTTTTGPYSERDIEAYIQGCFGAMRNPRGIFMESHTSSNGYNQLAAEVDKAATDTWSSALSPTSSTDYVLRNDDVVPIEYLAAVSPPAGNGHWLAPGQKVTVTVDGAAGEDLFIRTTRSGDTATLTTIAASSAVYDKLRATLANIKATFPDYYCETNALMQTQATSDSDYEAFRETGQTPLHLHLDTQPNQVHLSWGTAFSGADSGYYWWSLAAVRKLQSIGWYPHV